MPWIRPALQSCEISDRLCLWYAGETPGDENVSAMLEYFASIPHLSVLMNREATSVRGYSLNCYPFSAFFIEVKKCIATTIFYTWYPNAPNAPVNQIYSFFSTS